MQFEALLQRQAGVTALTFLVLLLTQRIERTPPKHELKNRHPLS